MHRTLNPQTLPIQILDLLLMQLSNWRWTWRGMVIIGTIAPILSILALGIFAKDSGPQSLRYILVGNIVLALMFENQGKVSGNFAFMRAMGTLNYFASLPIRRYSLVAATVLAFLLLSLPALTATAIFGAWFLNIQPHPNLLLIIVIPLAAFPLAGIGALIGASARNPEEANSLSTLMTFVMLGLGPVLIPPDRLPEVMNFLGRLSPATYAASALQQALLGPLTTRI
jgi:ABC-2 type transport system permease protein